MDYSDLDQEALVQSLPKHLTRISSTLNWTVLVLAIAACSVLTNGDRASVLGLELEDSATRVVVATVTLAAALSVMDAFHRIRLTLESLKGKYAAMGVAELALHPWYSNPYVPRAASGGSGLNLAGTPALFLQLGSLCCVPLIIASLDMSLLLLLLLCFLATLAAAYHFLQSWAAFELSCYDARHHRTITLFEGDEGVALREHMISQKAKKDAIAGMEEQEKKDGRLTRSLMARCLLALLVPIVATLSFRTDLWYTPTAEAFAPQAIQPVDSSDNTRVDTAWEAR